MANTIRDYSATAALNTVVDGADISEGCSPAGINDAIRGVMADLKDVSTGAVALESPAMDSLTVDTTGIVYSGGKVGIGTSSPAYTIDAASSGNTQIHLKASGQADGLEIGQLTADGGSSITATNNNYLKFGTNNTERMRITSAGRVGIGTASPSAKLDIRPSNDATNTFRIYRGVDSGYQLDYLNISQYTGDSIFNSVSSGGANNEFIFQQNATERMRIDSSGRVTMPYQPAFTASGGGNPTHGAGVLRYSSTSQDGFNLNVGSHYNTSNYRFTAPVSGNYFFCFNTYTDGSSSFDAVFRINGSPKGPAIQDLTTSRTGSNTYVSLSVSTIMPLNANDYVDVATNHRAYVDGNCFFSGYLIG